MEKNENDYKIKDHLRKEDDLQLKTTPEMTWKSPQHRQVMVCPEFGTAQPQLVFFISKDMNNNIIIPCSV